MDRASNRIRTFVGAGMAAALLLAACSSKPATRAAGPQRGGTLRVGADEQGTGTGLPFLDPPQAGFDHGLFRCCLVRALLGYAGRPTNEGGTVLRPDLAARLPEVSADGLTWTFTIKPNIHYAPPLQARTVVASDFVRGIERVFLRSFNELAQNGGIFADVIQGARAFGDGNVPSISGLEVPNDGTLVVRLIRPAGDFGNRMGLLFAMPIPANPADPSARLGIAEGHDADFERFLPSTGPYMIEGSENLDFSVPAKKQKPVSGYLPHRSLVLVRNPSWSPSTDPLRPAYVDRIEVTIRDPTNDSPEARLVVQRRFAEDVAAGRIDLLLDDAPPPEVVARYQGDPALRGRVFVYPLDGIRFLTLNLGVPPFDDLHVRKAVNLALDKAGVLKLRPQGYGRVAHHIAVDSLENDLLVDYSPYPTPNDSGDASKARAEMAQSPYDSDRDGVCDAAACRNSLFIVRGDPPNPASAALMVKNLRSIGIVPRVKVEVPFSPEFVRIFDPKSRVALTLGTGWVKDFPNASSFFDGLFTSASIEQSVNASILLGASADQLRKWGYSVRSVPSVDDKISECVALFGDAQTKCWTELDQTLMEQIVPWVPLMVQNGSRIVSDRVSAYSWNQSDIIPALDRIAVTPAAASPAAS